MKNILFAIFFIAFLFSLHPLLNQLEFRKPIVGTEVEITLRKLTGNEAHIVPFLHSEPIMIEFSSKKDFCTRINGTGSFPKINMDEIFYYSTIVERRDIKEIQVLCTNDPVQVTMTSVDNIKVMIQRPTYFVLLDCLLLCFLPIKLLLWITESF